MSVSELGRQLRLAAEGLGLSLWVEGEVSSFKRAPSGHVYFTLKDQSADACVECVMYKLDAMRALRHLAEGAKIQLCGRATVWAPRGRLQFVGHRARPAGRGALLVALEALKQKLAEEGLMSPARKRSLPREPRVVGVVTSASGAAFHDIRTVAFRRGSVRLVLSSALVQGDAAPESLLKALDRIERYPGLDCVIVGRGGGSGEDLMAFNDERVVRRIAGFNVPVVSAVGHETDVSLCDLVADVRAATPSQAAELVVPDRSERYAALVGLRNALKRGMRTRLLLAGSSLSRQISRLGDPRFAVVERRQDLDDLMARLRARSQRALARRGQLSAQLLGRLLTLHPRAVIAEQRARLLPLQARLAALSKASLQNKRARLSRHVGRLHALSPLSVLSRGYSIALTPAGSALREPGDVEPGDLLSIRLLNGSVRATVTETLPNEPPSNQPDAGTQADGPGGRT